MIRIYKRFQSTVKWFYATDVPISKPLDSNYVCTKIPQKFLPFSTIDSQKLESQWRRLEKDPQANHIVNVNEDGLFDCDLKTKDIKPAFWKGPNYEVRRGIWFLNNQPLPDLLSLEIERQYQIYKPILEMKDKEAPGIKLKSEAELWKIRQRELNPKTEPIWPYKEWDDLTNTPKILHFKDLNNALLLNQGQMLPKIVADSFNSSNEYLGVFPISRGYKMNEKKENENNNSNDIFSIQNAFGFEQRIFKGDPSEVADAKFQKFMEDDFANDNLSIANSSEREIDHLIIAVHGIGQSLSSKYSGVNFSHDCNYLRQLLKKEFVKNFERYGDMAHPNEHNIMMKQNCKVQILPVIWRNELDFGWDHVYNEYESDGETRRLPKLSELNLDGAGVIRSLAADVVLDVLLYYEPNYRSKILEIVTKKFNDIYDLYLKKHPNFKGKVSLLGHSLGSAIVLDIADKQPDHLNKDTSIDPLKQLKFDVENIFCLGSPNGVFQFIKRHNIRPRSDEGDSMNKKVIQPKTNNLYNLFYASDVVAYRMEPLIHSSLGDYEPKSIDVPTKTEVIKSKMKQIDVPKILFERFGWKMDIDSVVGDVLNSEKELELSPEAKNLLFKLNKNGRIDYILPKGIFDIDMINAIASHIQYFNDSDVANFLLGELWKKPDPQRKIKGSRKVKKSSKDVANNKT